MADQAHSADAKCWVFGDAAVTDADGQRSKDTRSLASGSDSLGTKYFLSNLTTGTSQVTLRWTVSMRPRYAGEAPVDEAVLCDVDGTSAYGADLVPTVEEQSAVLTWGSHEGLTFTFEAADIDGQPRWFGDATANPVDGELRVRRMDVAWSGGEWTLRVELAETTGRVVGHIEGPLHAGTLERANLIFTLSVGSASGAVPVPLDRWVRDEVVVVRDGIQLAPGVSTDTRLTCASLRIDHTYAPDDGDNSNASSSSLSAATGRRPSRVENQSNVVLFPPRLVAERTMEAGFDDGGQGLRLRSATDATVDQGLTHQSLDGSFRLVHATDAQFTDVGTLRLSLRGVLQRGPVVCCRGSRLQRRVHGLHAHPRAPRAHGRE